MSATVNNASFELIKPEAAPVPAPPTRTPPPTGSGHEALQALLAFSALHEQIRTHRARRMRDGLPSDSQDDSQIVQFVLDEVLQLVAERALAITGADGVAIALAEYDAIVCRASAGSIAPDAGVRLDPRSGFSGECLVSGRIVRCDDADIDPRVNLQACRRLGVRSMLAVPLSAKQNVVGLVEAFSSEPYGFNDSDVRSLNLLAELILSAMKPEEEDRLSEISRRVVPAAAIEPKETLINSNFVISSAAESPVYGRICGVEKPALAPARLSQSFPKAIPEPALAKVQPAPSPQTLEDDTEPAGAPRLAPFETRERHSVSDENPKSPNPSQGKETLTNSNFVISSAAESPVNGRICGVEKPALAPATLNQSFPKALAQPGLAVVAAVVMFAAALGAGVWWTLGHRAHSITPSARPHASAPPTAQPKISAAEATASAPPALEPVKEDERDSSPSTPEEAGLLPQITGIRHWSSAESSTVVIDMQDQVQYEAHRLPNPERIYFDLQDTTLATNFSSRTIAVNDALLQRVRVAQPMAGVTRVVLETNGASDFSVSLEPNPYRLVVEVRKLGTKPRARANIDLFAPLNPASPDQTATKATPVDQVAVNPKAPDQAALNPISLQQIPLNPLPQSSAPASATGDKRSQPVSALEPLTPIHAPKLRIALDAGHGGWDLGGVGRQGLLEKDLVLDIVKRLGHLVESRLGAQVVYTRQDDSYLALEKRAEIANLARANLFVSIHANYSDYPSARGVETYYTNTYSSVKARTEDADDSAAPSFKTINWTNVDIREKVHESHRIAASVQRSLYAMLAANHPGLRNRGVKQAQYVVLTGASMPAILAEVSFVSSPTDENNLQSTTYRQQIAEALYTGIAHYQPSHRDLKIASTSAKPTGK